MAMPLEPGDITGLVLAGGRGSRMGGVDKGLQPWRGRPLVAHALERLRPQVGALAINANRHLDEYADWGCPVWPDAEAGFPGPLAGFLAGLGRAATPWLVTVPCDSPCFPADLVQRLVEGLQGADLALAATRAADGSLQPQPVFCLMRCSLATSLAEAMAGGERRIDRWTGRQRSVAVVFDDDEAFFNANTLEDLQR